MCTIRLNLPFELLIVIILKKFTYYISTAYENQITSIPKHNFNNPTFLTKRRFCPHQMSFWGRLMWAGDCPQGEILENGQIIKQTEENKSQQIMRGHESVKNMKLSESGEIRRITCSVPTSLLTFLPLLIIFHTYKMNPNPPHSTPHFSFRVCCHCNIKNRLR